MAAALLALSLALPVTVSAAQVSSPTAGEDALYTDPDGRFTIPIPTNWIAEEHEGFVSVLANDRKVSISLVIVPGTSASEAIVQAMKLIEPDSDATPLPELMATPSSGSDDVALYTYDDGSASGQLVQAYGQRVNDVVIVLVLQGDLDTVALRQVQVDKVRYGIQIFPDKLGTPAATPAG